MVNSPETVKHETSNKAGQVVERATRLATGLCVTSMRLMPTALPSVAMIVRSLTSFTRLKEARHKKPRCFKKVRRPCCGRCCRSRVEQLSRLHKTTHRSGKSPCPKRPIVLFRKRANTGHLASSSRCWQIVMMQYESEKKSRTVRSLISLSILGWLMGGFSIGILSPLFGSLSYPKPCGLGVKRVGFLCGTPAKT